MTAIDNLVENLEAKIDKIKYRPIKDFTRGFFTEIDIIPSLIEVNKLGPQTELGPQKFLISSPPKLCTIGVKNFKYFYNDLDFPFNTKKSIPMIAAFGAGMIVGGFLTAYTYGAPWAAAGAVDLVNLYLKKKEKKQNDPGK